ncbi:MAG: aminotransferase class I/II-fold pyridoxal phosphate-dependent enzyme, partial [Acidobacteriota bacterium]
MSDQRSSVQVETVDAVTSDSRRRGLTYLSTLDERLDGRSFRIARPGGDREMIFFGSCSYLGLETHPALVEGARAAAASHGTQFSSSRAFVSVGLYDTLEDLFRQIFRGHEVVISATTTLGHLAALPVLARPDDAILLDQQVHASVQTAAQVAKGQGTRLTVLPHNQVAPLERKIKSWRARHGRLWLAVDGVYSMFGNVPHLDSLIELMDRYPELHLYIDDAHGMSWAGELGCGLTLHRLGRLSERIVMATSLAKAFGCGGGVLVFGNPEWARLVRQCGGTLVFSGPIQPPVLGAAIASARLHASGEIHGYQRELQNKVRLADRELQTRGLPLLSTPGVPILFVPVGLPKGVYEILQRMMKDGFYLDAGVFPATPMKRGGV